MKINSLPVIVGLLIWGCAAKEQRHADEISGTYVREYSFKVINPEQGAEIGMRTVRDTIFIRPVGDRFEVSNHKWLKNSYDLEGWQNMQHSGDRPKPSYTSTYDPELNALVNAGVTSLHFDSEHRNAFWDAKALYVRVGP